MVSMITPSRVSSLKVTVPLNPMWCGEYPGQQGWMQTEFVLSAILCILSRMYRESVPRGRWGSRARE